MATKKINEYISTRYNRWLDYAIYQAAAAGLGDEGGDILNEVLLDLLKKPNEKLEDLYQEQKGEYRGLDYFILKSVKMNAISKTAPYRWRYHKCKKDENPDLSREEDQGSGEGLSPEEDQESGSDYLCTRSELLRVILEELNIPEAEKEIFRWRALLNRSLSKWPGPEKNVWKIFQNVKALIVLRANNKAQGYRGAITRLNKKALRIQLEYKSTPYPWLYKVSPRYRETLASIEEYKQKLKFYTV